MSRFLCCLTCGLIDRRYDDGSKMDELMAKPDKIDTKLETKIDQWQQAINDYQSYEEICMDELPDEVKPILSTLRKYPKMYTNKKKYSANIVTLANKRVKLNDIEGKLDSSRKQLNDGSLFCCCIPFGLCGMGGRRKLLQGRKSLRSNRDSVAPSTNTSMSDRLSERWASRLNGLDPTQGKLRNSASGPRYDKEGVLMVEDGRVDSTQAADLKLKPKWPDFLIDACYDVMKVNLYGHKMRRIIKLNQYYVLNIKNGKEITKFYSYRDVRRVWLESDTTLVVVLRNNRQHVYMSPIATHILQQISTRVQVRNSLDKADFSGVLTFSLGYSAQVTSSIIKSISEENTIETEVVVAAFAKELKERTVISIKEEDRENEAPQQEEQENTAAGVENSVSSSNPMHGASASSGAGEVAADAGVGAGAGAGAGAGELASAVAAVANEFASPFANSIQNAKKETAIKPSYAPKFMSFREGMPEFAVQSAIQQLIFDLSSSEGNTRSVFLNGFKKRILSYVAAMAPAGSSRSGSGGSSRRSGATIGSSLSSGNLSSAGSTTASSSNCSTATGSTRGAAAGEAEVELPTIQEVRHFIDGMHEYILSHRGVSLALLFERERQRTMINEALAEGKKNHNSKQQNDVSGTLDKDISGGTVGSIDDDDNDNNNNNNNNSGAAGDSSKRWTGFLASQRTNNNNNNNNNNSSSSSSRNNSNGFTPRTTGADGRTLSGNDLTSRESLQFLKDNNLDLSLMDEDIVIFVSFVIFVVVEEAIFLPLKNDIIYLLPSSHPAKKEEEVLLMEKMRVFSKRTQEQWGIPEDLVSPLGWQSAVFELTGLEHNLTPSIQLHILTRTVKAVYNEFKFVILPRLNSLAAAQGQTPSSSSQIIAADDLVPIFIFIFCKCHAHLKNPMRNRDLMWSLCHPDQLHGESGYYLTVYESAIEFVLNEPIVRYSEVLAQQVAQQRHSLGIGQIRNSIRASINRFSTGSQTHNDRNSATAAGVPVGSTTSNVLHEQAAGGGRGNPLDISLPENERSSVDDGRTGGQGLGYPSPLNANHILQENRRSSASSSDARRSSFMQRFSLVHLLSRTPAADNTTRESFH